MIASLHAIPMKPKGEASEGRIANHDRHGSQTCYRTRREADLDGDKYNHQRAHGQCEKWLLANGEKEEGKNAFRDKNATYPPMYLTRPSTSRAPESENAWRTRPISLFAHNTPRATL